MNRIAQDMQYRHSLPEYARKHGGIRASRKYHKSRSYIYFRRARYDALCGPWPAIRAVPIAKREAMRNLHGNGRKTCLSIYGIWCYNKSWT